MRTNRTTITCVGCGTQIEMHSYRLRNGTGKYCGQACYLAHRWSRDKTCKNCGKACEIRYCSPECQKSYWNKHGGAIHKHPKNWKRKIDLLRSLGGKCSICGFDDVRALDIDHVDPATKVKAKTGYSWGRRFKDWTANAGNLRILCANCHRLHTWEQRGYGRGISLLDKEVGLPIRILDPATCD
jgi:hypothetical protein